MALLDMLTLNSASTLAVMGVTAERNGNESGFCVLVDVLLARMDRSMSWCCLMPLEVLGVHRRSLGNRPTIRRFATIVERGGRTCDAAHVIVAAWTV